MRKFIKYLSGSHLKGKNVAVYENDDMTLDAVLENIVTGKKIYTYSFSSKRELYKWWDEIEEEHGEDILAVSYLYKSYFSSIYWCLEEAEYIWGNGYSQDDAVNRDIILSKIDKLADCEGLEECD